MLKFLKKNKMIVFLASSIGLLSASVAIATISWFSLNMQIDPPTSTETSGIITSYFDSLDDATGDPGSETNPFVITRPIHYYNLVYLIENDYSEFDGNNTHFQFGKDLDESGTEKFYLYDDNGVQQTGYSTSLNMNYYGTIGDPLAPLGDAHHPFYGVIDGKGLTVNKLHITGFGKADIGIFGYVGPSASISNLYFDNVDIDLNVMDVSELTGAGDHIAHSIDSTPFNCAFGYIAGHVYDTDSFNNVYVNNAKVRNSASGLSTTVKNQFGYFGYCDSATSPNIGEEAYRYTLNPSDVYNYFTNNYSSISGMTLKTRNTEYTGTGSFSNAVSSGSGYYRFNNSAGKAYSLATAGFQKGDQTYIAQYKDGSSYSPMTGASVTNTAAASQTEAGYYVYYNSGQSKWQYYTVDKTGGETITTNYNVFSLSYKGVYNETYNTTYYLYYDSSTNTLKSNTTAPTNYATNPEYYFAFLRSTSDTGISYIEDGNGTSTTYLIYSPSSQKYMYQNLSQNVGTRTSLQFGDLATATSASVTNRFTLTGPTGANISYNVTGGACSLSGDISGKDNSPKGRATNGQNPALSITVTGASQSSRTIDDGYEYQMVESVDDLSTDGGDVVAFVYIASSTGSGNAANHHAMSATQNGNNRGVVDPSFPTANDFSVITYSSSIGEFTTECVVVSGTTYFRFKTEIDNDDGYGYLVLPSNNNYLRTTQYGQASNVAHTDTGTYWSLADHSFTAKDNNTYTNIQIRNRAYSSRYLQYNHSGNLFASYTNHDNGSYSSPVLYKRVATQATLYRQNAYVVSASTTSDEIITYEEYDIYYYDNAIGTSDRRLLTVAPALVNSWSLSGSPTTVTLAPESLNGWNIVTGNAGLIVGEKYIIASNTSSKVAYGYDTSNHRMNSVAATFNGDKTKITAIPNGAYEFTLGGNSSDGYTLTCEAGQLYAESNANSVNFTGNSGSGLFTITIGASNAATVTIGDSYAIKYNASGYFNNYSSGSAIQLYRRDTSDPQYIGDKIGNGYNPNYIDTVGSIDYYSSYFRMASTSAEEISDTFIDNKFYNTQFTDGGLVLRIPNRGSLDYGTLTIRCGANSPVFFKSSGSTVTYGDVACTNTGTSSNQEYILYLNKYNIYQLSYCVLNNGNIVGAYGTGQDDELFMKSSTSIDEFVLIIGAPTASNVDISYVDIAFSTIKGNYGDFGNVGYRTAGSAAAASAGSYYGEVFNFTYDLPSGGYVYSDVRYDASTNTYYLNFKSTVALTLYVYNYDANRAIVYVNGTRKNGPYNAISISASSSPGTGGWTSYS